ncbi:MULTISPECIES: HAD family hydrolase [Pseudonocardia]|uniref:Haloacid dehalogenase-like hydrolase n=2 Tax=Pseudonocardia TaxID=1847 RepID=A0A1Y2MNI6_PSEAH|nr:MULTISPECIES: HAD-IB family phosphatase [Pseudonocardia]OSY36814.1 haloacid dehalogenase-like hydrolase [Pseudonocardia autotrophica]TDN76805.1 HAD superfamily phosphoserine phosphatase-like hydrolase [Pseudonocardia autotrophica]BBG00806.1 hypothetical protein Pdca_20150 [Pseudonocardia autotrophica]GEC29462.1 hypothetical protein PSA01_64910 [Pseudonocardia saturnea]
MKRLHVFDMDGTLLRGAASVELSRHLGRFEAADRIEQEWGRGEIGSVTFWERMLPLWRDVSEDRIDAAFRSSAWLDGVPEVFADIRGRGEMVAVISQSPHFFVRRLTGWGAHRTYGSAVEPGAAVAEDGLLTLQHKVDITTGLLDELGLQERDCVAYGDSTSDLLLFDRLPNTVGVNCNDEVRARASVCFTGDDLRGAYALGRQLLERAATGSGP